MTREHMAHRRVLALGLAAILAACQAPPVSPGAVKWVAPEDAAFRIGHPVPRGEMQFVRFQDVWQREDYGIYRDDGVTAEVVLMAADRRLTASLEYEFSIKRGVETFRAVSAGAPDWGPVEAVPGWRRDLFYRPFSLDGGARGCVGFSGFWHVIHEDPKSRPRYALIGYVCEAGGGSMTPERATAIVQTIRVKNSAVLRPGTDRPDAGADAALAFARGKGEYGNPSFPFRLARFYTVGNGSGGID